MHKVLYVGCEIASCQYNQDGEKCKRTVVILDDNAQCVIYRKYLEKNEEKKWWTRFRKAATKG